MHTHKYNMSLYPHPNLTYIYAHTLTGSRTRTRSEACRRNTKRLFFKYSRIWCREAFAKWSNYWSNFGADREGCSSFESVPTATEEDASEKFLAGEDLLVYARIFMHKYAYMYTCIHAYRYGLMFVQVGMFLYIYIYIYIYICTHIHTCMHT